MSGAKDDGEAAYPPAAPAWPPIAAAASAGPLPARPRHASARSLGGTFADAMQTLQREAEALVARCSEERAAAARARGEGCAAGGNGAAAGAAQPHGGGGGDAGGQPHAAGGRPGGPRGGDAGGRHGAGGERQRELCDAHTPQGAGPAADPQRGGPREQGSDGGGDKDSGAAAGRGGGHPAAALPRGAPRTADEGEAILLKAIEALPLALRSFYVYFRPYERFTPHERNTTMKVRRGKKVLGQRARPRGKAGAQLPFVEHHAVPRRSALLAPPAQTHCPPTHPPPPPPSGPRTL